MLAGLLCDENVNIVHAVAAQQRIRGGSQAIDWLRAGNKYTP